MPRWICIRLAPSLLDLCILTAGKMPRCLCQNLALAARSSHKHHRKKITRPPEPSIQRCGFWIRCRHLPVLLFLVDAVQIPPPPLLSEFCSVGQQLVPLRPYTLLIHLVLSFHLLHLLQQRLLLGLEAFPHGRDELHGPQRLEVHLAEGNGRGGSSGRCGWGTCMDGEGKEGRKERKTNDLESK